MKFRTLRSFTVISSSLMKTFFSTSASSIFRQLCFSQSSVICTLINKFAMALLICIFALVYSQLKEAERKKKETKKISSSSSQIQFFVDGSRICTAGAAIGAVTGAIKGQTTETGLSRGFGVGAVSGAITGVQLMELVASGEPFSKVALIRSLVNGKIFMEWVSPAVLKAYQWQVSAMETSTRDFSDIFDVNTYSGLSQDTVNGLPVNEFSNAETATPCCAICLMDLKDGESARSLPKCKHIFHIHCIDQWLIQQGSCPICRKHV